MDGILEDLLRGAVFWRTQPNEIVEDTIKRGILEN
jgi:hypothetical protein